MGDDAEHIREGLTRGRSIPTRLARFLENEALVSCLGHCGESVEVLRAAQMPEELARLAGDVGSHLPGVGVVVQRVVGDLNFSWKLVDGVAVVHSARKDLFISGTDLLREPLSGGEFEGTLSEFVRWLSGHRVSPGRES